MLFIVYSYIVSAVCPAHAPHSNSVQQLPPEVGGGDKVCAAAVQVQFWAVLAHLVSPLSAIS